MVRRQDHDMQSQKDSHTDEVSMGKKLSGMSAWNSRFDRSEWHLSLEPSRVLICTMYFLNYENKGSLYFTKKKRSITLCAAFLPAQMSQLHICTWMLEYFVESRVP